jgi:hypothetical protein
MLGGDAHATANSVGVTGELADHGTKLDGFRSRAEHREYA